MKPMKVEIQNEQEQKLLSRKDYTLRVAHEGATPGRDKLAGALAKNLNTKKELVVIRRIGPVFGSTASIVDASVYNDADSINKYEQAWVVKRHEKASAKEEAPAEAPAPEAPAEKPAEEAADEKPAEEPAKEEAPTEEKTEEPAPKEEKKEGDD